MLVSQPMTLYRSPLFVLTTVCPRMFVPTSNIDGTAVDRSLSCCIIVPIVAGTVLGLLLLVTTSLNSTTEPICCYQYFLTHYFPYLFIFMAAAPRFLSLPFSSFPPTGLLHLLALYVVSCGVKFWRSHYCISSWMSTWMSVVDSNKVSLLRASILICSRLK